MRLVTFTPLSEEEMLKVGEELINFCQPPCVVYLEGNLGAGKTTLVRGFLRGLGYIGAVKSPTYTLVESYTLQNKTICHFDLYRVHDPEELALMGIRDYFTPSSICFIEWPQQGGDFLPPPTLRCTIDFLEQGRVVKLEQ